MRIRIVAGLVAAFGLIGTSTGASAAIWAWGCQAQVGAQQIIFNRYSMVVVDTKQKMGDVRRLRPTEIDPPPGSPPNVKYVAEGDDEPFEKTIVFKRPDDDKRKVTFTEKSSHKISHTHKLICGRDEDTDLYRKVYSYQREDEPVRTITMQCMEYQLSTRGGRKGCGDD